MKDSKDLWGSVEACLPHVHAKELKDYKCWGSPGDEIGFDRGRKVFETAIVWEGSSKEWLVIFLL